MKRKLKSFFEDFLTIAVIIAIIYASYTYFFDDEESSFESINSQVVVQDAFKSEIKEPNQEDVILDKVTNKNEDEEDESLVDITDIESSIKDENSSTNLEPDNSFQEKESEETEIERTPSTLVKNSINALENSGEKSGNSPKFNFIDTSKLEISSSSQEQSKKEKFYSDLKSRIVENLNSLDTSLLNKNSSANFRVTILKDGRYEQIFFDGGNSELFKLTQQSVAKVFPLEIDSELKHLFPRYYRFKIEFN